jgi:hypothetical protein
MRPSPYRVAAERFNEDSATEPVHDADLIPVFVIVWSVSMARVVVGLVRHETFGVEPTMALLTALLLPVLGKNALCWLVRRGQRNRSARMAHERSSP